MRVNDSFTLMSYKERLAKKIKKNQEKRKDKQEIEEEPIEEMENDKEDTSVQENSEDFYALLGVEKTATQKEIRSAYYKGFNNPRLLY